MMPSPEAAVPPWVARVFITVAFTTFIVRQCAAE
jgi:hypothetical protein